MSGLFTLLALLLAAYLGAELLAARRGVGLPAGTPWLLLGFAAGPAGLALLDDEVLFAFRQVALVSVGWVALTVGLEYGFLGERPIRWRSLALGHAGALLTAGLVFGAAALVLAGGRSAGVLATPDQRVLALGLAAVLCDTGREAFRWAARWARPEGGLRRLLAEVSDGDDLVPVALAAVAFAVGGAEGAAPHGLAARVGADLGLGVALGGIAVALLAGPFRRNLALGTLFGASLLALGLAARLGLSGLLAGLALGLVLHLLSRHGPRLRALAVEIERPIAAPALLLAGASLAPGAHPQVLVLAAVTLGARLAGKLLAAGLLAAAAPEARRGGLALGPALAATGPLGPVIGLAFALRFPGPLGQAVLTCACAASLAGELCAGLAVRAALARAGEVPAAEDGPLAADPEARP